MNLATQYPGAAMSKAQLRRSRQMRERVVEACLLVESRRVVRGVHIVSKGKPTNDELQQFQDFADQHHVQLSVDSHGMISVRPRAMEKR